MISFLKAPEYFQPEVVPIYVDKKTRSMVTQYWPWNDRLDDVVDFMKARLK
jgi:hypothetical protein